MDTLLESNKVSFTHLGSKKDSLKASFFEEKNEQTLKAHKIQRKIFKIYLLAITKGAKLIDPKPNYGNE